MKVLIIIPAYNEAQNIEKTVKDVTENTDFDYVVINDCSKDNSKEIYDVCLTRLGIRQYFGLVLDVNSCKDGKNSPEIYDRAISHFNVKREETLILEDMIVPIITAHNAGYNVIAVYDEESTKDEKACIDNSDLFIKNFGEVLDCLK